MIEWLTRRDQDNQLEDAMVLTHESIEAEPLIKIEPPQAARVEAPLQKASIVFDVSDLIQYFNNARLPTGIQRVQIEIITKLIFSDLKGRSITIAYFTKTGDEWRSLRPLFFNHICHLALIGGEKDGVDWIRCLEELDAEMDSAPPLSFSKGAVLVNLGTSWWLQNYFMHVRLAKARYNIYYVPFVHDCIPILTPEHCTEGLTRDFISWAIGAFQHADHVLVNSNATAGDVRRVATYLGHDIDDPTVIKLDADYRSATTKLSAPSGVTTASAVLERHGLTGSAGFVLSVGTIESRKNHGMAFSAWLTLIKKHGLQKVPILVCVGNRGWLNDAVYAKLQASKLLRSKVVMLSHVPDTDLAQLYQNCLFTLYPSSYEGWGLPVTESLCFGKVPVLSNNSSLPEAGGPFAEYFEPGAEHELVAILERLTYDEPYRSAREIEIGRDFKARSWEEIAEQLTSSLDDLVARKPQRPQKTTVDRDLWPFPAEMGSFHALTENTHCHIYSGMTSSEVFRQGDAWWWPETWGCWTKPRPARLAFTAQLDPAESAMVYIGLRSVQGRVCEATVTLKHVGSKTISLSPGLDRWAVFKVSPPALEAMPKSSSERLIELMISADCFADFSEATGGVDVRQASVGVLGFLVCRSLDVEARMSFMESLALGTPLSAHRYADDDVSQAFIA